MKKKNLIRTIFFSSIVVGGIFLFQQNYHKTNQLRELRFEVKEINHSFALQAQNQQNEQLALAELQTRQNQVSISQNWNVASYLIRTANIELSILHDPDQAQQLLIAAIAALASDESPRAQTLKTAISSDLASLSQNSSTNVELKLQEINSLYAQVAALTVLSPKNFHPATPLPTQSAGTWWQHIKADLMDLGALVVIRHNDKPIRPLLSNSQLELLKAAVRSQLSLAQWAVVTHQVTTYQTALNNAAAWLMQYDGENNQAQLIAEQITALAQKPLNVPIGNLQSWQLWQNLNSKN